MSLKYYHFYLCPFCKPVGFLLNENKVPHEEIHLDLFKSEQKSEDYKKINPFQKVPAIIDDGFIIFESSTLLRYVSNSKEIEDYWYPKDPKKRAKIDLYFDWHAANIFNLQTFTFFKLGIKKMTDEEARAASEKAAIELIDVFLSRSKYLVSDEKITIADIALIYHLATTRQYGFEYPKRVEEYYNDILASNDNLKADVNLYLTQRENDLIKKKN